MTCVIPDVYLVYIACNALYTQQQQQKQQQQRFKINRCILDVVALPIHFFFLLHWRFNNASGLQEEKISDYTQRRPGTSYGD